VVSFMAWPLYPWGKSPWYPLDRRLGCPQSWSGQTVARRKIPSPYQDSNPPDHLAHGPAVYLRYPTLLLIDSLMCSQLEGGISVHIQGRQDKGRNSELCLACVWTPSAADHSGREPGKSEDVQPIVLCLCW